MAEKGRTEQSGYQFKKYKRNCPVKPFMQVEQQVEKLTETNNDASGRNGWLSGDPQLLPPFRRVTVLCLI
jgi:hypothetical protein